MGDAMMTGEQVPFEQRVPRPLWLHAPQWQLELSRSTPSQELPAQFPTSVAPGSQRGSPTALLPASPPAEPPVPDALLVEVELVETIVLSSIPAMSSQPATGP